LVIGYSLLGACYLNWKTEGELQAQAVRYASRLGIVLLLGLGWIAVYYIAGERVPFMQDIGALNLLIGFGLMVIGLVMAVRWR
jgi:cytochrome bd-type quinol oxidase subunit 2